MSQKLIDHNPDLRRLQGEGYDVSIAEGYLLVHGVPYVNSRREVARGILVMALNLVTTEQVGVPPNHVAFFSGEVPCDESGKVLAHVVTGSGDQLMGGITTHHTFSACPEIPFKDYNEKVMSYVNILSHHAKNIDPILVVPTFKVRDLTEDEESVFNYPDTNSSRGNIGGVSSKLKDIKVGIIGLGGTGSYVLDFVSKTTVKEIHLYDKDAFHVHNAFRFPGAPSVEKINEKKSKISYLSEVYSQMRKKIIQHESFIAENNFHELAELNFVFICIDQDEIKEKLFSALIGFGIPFIDVGMGVELVDGLLLGQTRVTLGTVDKNDHLQSRVSFGGNNKIYSNIQIAELNALNAAQAVIKWKKYYGLYHDLKKEHNATYALSTNRTEINEINT